MIYTVFFEVISIILYGIIMFYLIKQRDYVSSLQIVAGSIFGVSLEFMNVLIFDSYTYSTNFIIQVGAPPLNIPIVIGLCWGLIIYSCIQISDALNIPSWYRPILDGLLALTIDLSMDTIAIRIEGGLWTWKGIPMESFPTLRSFFGVNYGNFVGWFLVVSLFSVLIRLEESFNSKKDNSIWIRALYYIIIPFFAYIPLYIAMQAVSRPVILLLDVIGTIPTEYYFGIFGIIDTLAIIIGSLTGLGIIILKERPTIKKDVHWLELTVFMTFHLTYIPIYFLTGQFQQAPLILPLAVTMLVIDILIHWLITDRDKAKEQITRLIKR